MQYRELTQNEFQDLKADYDIYGTHTVQDKYNNEHLEKNNTVKCTIHTMFQPLTGFVAAAEYGRDISSMYFCILFEDYNIDYNDVVELFGDDYEVIGIKHFNTYDRIDVKKKAGTNG